MDTPVAVVVTNPGASWSKVLNCYGIGKDEVLNCLHLALTKVGKKLGGKSVVDHIAIPSLNRTATRGRLSDGYLYFFSSEANVFLLEPLVHQLVQIRCTSKSLGLTIEDIVKDSNKVVSMVESILVPHLLHCTTRLIEPHALRSEERKRKEAFDLSQSIERIPSGESMGSGRRVGLPSAPPMLFEDKWNASPSEENLVSGEDVFGLERPEAGPKSQGDETAAGTSTTIDPPLEGNNLFTGTDVFAAQESAEVDQPQSQLNRNGAEIDPFRQLEDVQGGAPLPQEEVAPPPSSAPADALDLFGLPIQNGASPVQDFKPEEEESVSTVQGGGTSATGAHAMEGALFIDASPMDLSQPTSLPDANRFGAVPDFQTTPSDGVPHQLPALSQESFETGAIAIARVSETVFVKVRSSCLRARCTGAIGIQCNQDRGANPPTKALVKINPQWMNGLSSLRILATTRLTEGLSLDCGSAGDFSDLRDVIHYTVRADRYAFPARVFFQIKVSPHAATLVLQILKSPALDEGIESADCLIKIPLGFLSNWTLKEGAPQPGLDDTRRNLVWRGSILKCAEPQAFRATFVKPRLVDARDLRGFESMEATVTSCLRHKAATQEGCRVMKTVNMTAQALPVVSVSTAFN